MRRLVTSLLTAGALTAVALGQNAPAPAKPKPAATKGPAAKAVEPPSVTVPSYKSLKFPPLREVRIPDVTQFTLKNGMRIYLLENHELPLVGGFALVRTGNLFDPADKVGLAQLTGTVMRTGGTKSKTGDELDEALESIAASVETSIGESSGNVSFNALKENTDDVLEIFKDLLLNPEFRQDKLDLARNQVRGSIARRNDDASGIAGREFTDIVYGKDNPYGWSMEYHHIDAIKRDDLIAFYKRYFFPANIRLAIQGDFKTAEMRSKLEKLFETWDYKQPDVPPFPAVSAKASPGVYLGTKDDVTQTFFRMGHLGGMLKDKDYPALSVMSDILGGGFSSRLFTNVRTKAGLAYNVSSMWHANYNHPGLFMIAGSTKSPSTVDAMQASKTELDRIRTAEVTDQELETAKQSVLNSFVFFFDHPNKILNRVVTYDYHGYPKDFIFQYQKGVEAVTKADVLRVAKEYLKPEQLTILAVGKPADFGKPLTTLGPVKPIDLTIPDPKATPSGKSDSASLQKGRQLFQRAQTALGGAEKLAAVKDFTQNMLVDVQAPQGAMQIKTTQQWIAPGVMRQTQELPFGKVVAFYDGKSGWLKTPQGEMAMPAPVLKQVQGEAFRNSFTLFLSDQNPDRTINAVDDNSFEVSDKAGERVRVEVDPATGLPATISYQSMGMQGPQNVLARLSDWSEVNGVKVPQKALIEQDGKKFGEGKLQSIQINSGLTAEQLSKKE